MAGWISSKLKVAENLLHQHVFPNRRSSGKPGRHAEAALAGENVQHPHTARDGTTTDSYVGSDARRTIVLPEAAGAAPDPLNDRLSLESRGDIGAAVSKTSIDKKLIEKAHTGIPAVAAWGKARDVDSSVSKEDEGIMVQPVTDLKGQAGAGRSETGSVEDVQESAVTLHGSPDMLSRITPKSSGSSESDSDSASSSDSEYESERKMERRKRKERVLAEKAAALAAEAIKERENLVARLEGEKQSLEKVVEERQKQQAQEASQLQSSMMEAMEAVEREKQKHNSTRMEALALLAELETRNAELARSLATTQWDLQVEVNRVMELREMVESKELAQEECQIFVRMLLQTMSAKYYFICDKIGQMKEKVGSLERNIQSTEGLLHPTEVEIELKKRLEQFTDHLIQKQAQVESLSSEKATLLFRIEGKNSPEGSARVDIEAGGRVNRPAALYSTLRPLIRAKIDSGERQLGSFVRQVDDVFAAGAVFLRKNPAAKVAAWAYLVCLHLWVAYILTSDSSPAAMAGSSSERINKTSVS
ncbi:unnamed protein product [Spirodela intermedia]|uniref:Uncharacterized protein n=1 Tax=Spirodela intermedia TaxID=51605 RepID=A0A7I8J2V5_SPIIN|nr:unnamed protein product [Spirodela intermedia]CAA6664312.1 unnamed protein product [Spirodela intermedia]